MQASHSGHFLCKRGLTAAAPALPQGAARRAVRTCPGAGTLFWLVLFLLIWRAEGVLLATWVPGCQVPPRGKGVVPIAVRDRQRLVRMLGLARKACDLRLVPPGLRPPAQRPAAAPAPEARDLLYTLMSLQR